MLVDDCTTSDSATPPQIVQSTAQRPHDTHTAYIMRCSLTEL